MILADKIIALRKKAGWSQEELAEQMNVSRQSVSKWEGAQSMPDMEKILLLSKLFGVSTDYLLKEEIDSEPTADPQVESEPGLRRVTMEEASEYLRLCRENAPGNAVAVDHDIAMGMRMKDDCQKTGEAAARLAALALSLIDSDGDICKRIEETLVECAQSRDGFVPKTAKNIRLEGRMRVLISRP